MVKYINKAKEVNGVALMEVSQSSFGVRTRAKTLALQERLKSPVSSSSPSSGSYLQLRSRKLEKKPIGIRTHETKRQKQAPNLGSMLRVSSVASDSDGFVSLAHVKDKDDGRKNKGTGGIFGRKQDIQDDKIKNNRDLGVEEASFGDNVLEIEGKERSTRESTPCSLIKDPDTIQTPGSTTRATTSSAKANSNIQSQSRRHIPTSHEMNEFFTRVESEQQKQFIDKYNFDTVREKPLAGRFEWEKINP